MPKFDYDLITIGAGSGGVRASRVAASYGAKVAIVEMSALGGTCVNVGCIPKKLLVYASQYRDEFYDSQFYGWTLKDKKINLKKLITNKDREIKRLNHIYANLLDQSGVQRIKGRAHLIDAHTVQVGKKRYSSHYILVATGGWPILHDIPGREFLITSNEVFSLKKIPHRILIIGGGYIALEFAGIFHGLGSQVTLVHRRSLFLRGFDEDLRQTLAVEMGKKGIRLIFNTELINIEKRKGQLHATLKNKLKINVDQVLCAIGRAPQTQRIGLEEIGIQLNPNGAILVDSFSRTQVPNIYAVGDCTNRMQLTPVAIAEGQAVAETLFHNRPTKPDYRNVPKAIFSQPNLSTVGLAEEEARQKYRQVEIYRSSFRALKNTLSNRIEKTMLKLVVDGETDKVLGCHMVGPEAGEIIQCLAIALKCGATKKQFDATMGLHPTIAEEFVTMRQKILSSAT